MKISDAFLAGFFGAIGVIAASSLFGIIAYIIFSLITRSS